jgi:molybdopterin molybdotransferase
VTRSLADARDLVIATVRSLTPSAAETVPLDAAFGRVLAEDVPADRDQPPFHRATRDGFAVRAADVPGTVRVIGEIAAGRALDRAVGPGEAAEIMTGAPLPSGADCVVMVEHTTRAADRVTTERTLTAGENVVPAGAELAAGALAVAAGTPIGTAEIAMLASVGRAVVPVRARPRVAIVATGEELVDVAATPGPSQIRESNGPTLAAQVLRAGGVPVRLPPARDDAADLRGRLERALEADLILFSGGVSMGKYDHVEGAHAAAGGTIVWDGAAIRPGKPVVFGLVHGRPFFGLPGNPLSTLVTFELFARPALELLGGAAHAPLRWLRVRLAEDHRQGPLPLTHFVPGRLDGALGDATVLPLRAQGSGDVAALTRADGFIVVEPQVTHVPAGTLVPFMPR